MAHCASSDFSVVLRYSRSAPKVRNRKTAQYQKVRMPGYGWEFLSLHTNGEDIVSRVLKATDSADNLEQPYSDYVYKLSRAAHVLGRSLSAYSRVCSFLLYV